jgi:signal peptidase I
MKEKLKTWWANQRNKRFVAVIGAVLLFLVIFIILRFFMWFPTVKGSSMEPALANGNVICVSRVKDAREGDICLFWSNSLGEYVVKRVVAIGECDITITSEGLFKDGELMEEDYVSDPTWLTKVEPVEFHVGEGEYFALGDNRLHSVDSRSFGPMKDEEFVGVMLGRIL